MQILIIIGVLLIARSQCFLKLPFNDEIQYHEVIDIEISNGQRSRRSTDNLNHIDTYDLDFEVERSNVKLHLVPNDKIHTNVPIYTMKHGSTKKFDGREKEDSIFYQDVKNDASFVIQRDLQGKHNMFGTFSFAGEKYIMQTSPQRNNSFDGRFENVHLIKERKRNVQFDDVFKIGDRFKHQNKYHRRRRATGSHQIELLIVCDYAIYSYWYAKSDKSSIQEKETDALTTVRQYYAFVLNGTPGDAPWTENIKDTSFTPNRVDSSIALGNFQAWVKLQTGLPDHDHAMLFTRYDLTASGLTGNAGLAFTSAVCSENSQSIVEEAFDFVVITTAAHELGHWANNNCMKTLSPSFDPTAQSPYDQFLAGQIYNADSQCVQMHGDGSYLCREQYNGDFSTICNILWCYKPDISQCQSSIAGEGTLCGNQKWCVSGVCTQDVKAPKGNENCLYGDRKGIIFSNLGWTCADAYANNPSLCFSQPIVSVFCCGSCYPETTTLSLSTQNYATSTEHVTTVDSDTTTSLKTTTEPKNRKPLPKLNNQKLQQHDETTTDTALTIKTDFVTTESVTTTTTFEETSVLTTKQVKTNTAIPTTTAQKVGTTKDVTTTGESTPTLKATIVSTDTTQQPDTSSVNVTDVVDNTDGIIDPVVIGVGIAVFGLTILGIVILCLTVYYRKHGKHSKYQNRSTNDFKNTAEPDFFPYDNPSTPVMVNDTRLGRWPRRVLHGEHYSPHDIYDNQSTISKGGIRPVWNAQYHYQDTYSKMGAYNFVDRY
ncbi:unnamed protein product [Mytilus coruscus]|uniref:Peptidase M12B domain-containing protein n=1 Tax=Mytilus coruscus TaxID=42192 RepID=A0A6J8AHF3_MYTCO|nr:unnamed protein product [Mytilus coruscus]